ASPSAALSCVSAGLARAALSLFRPARRPDLDRPGVRCIRLAAHSRDRRPRVGRSRCELALSVPALRRAGPVLMRAVATLVSGGGVAGAAAAAHLAQAGLDVMLVERRDGPHHKVCGEFVSGEAALYLDDLGVDLAALGAVRMRAVRLCAGRQVATAPLPFPAVSLSRRALDEALLRAALAAGPDVRRRRCVRWLGP